MRTPSRFLTLVLTLFSLYVAAVTSKWTLYAQETDTAPRYVFLLIGDGMGLSQRSAAELFEAAQGRELAMAGFPVHGMIGTRSENAVITDSAAAGTALACGRTTNNGVVAQSPDGRKLATLAEQAAERGMKVGIISSVSLDHATPACFYAHNKTRNAYYEIAMQLAGSDFHYFAGGGLRGETPGKRKGRPSVLQAARQNGFALVREREQLMALEPGAGKVLAISPELRGGQSMPYAMDAPEGCPTLADYTRKGIELLQGEDGFFMMVEGGKIDWACHANDAAATVHDVLAFDAAVKEAVDFYNKHPEETLVVVTADHATGGMTVGFAGTGYSSRTELLQAQERSHEAFDADLAPLVQEKASLGDALELARRSFGLHVPGEQGGDDPLALSAHEVQLLAEAWEATLAGAEARARNPQTRLLYGKYPPFTVTCTRILAQKAGIAWTSYAHTGEPVPVMALGTGADAFKGYTPNTQLAVNLRRIMGLTQQTVEQ